MSKTLPRILVFGAHPDDAEFHIGGLLSLYRELDFAVKIISVTSGAAGHYNIAGDVLARRRLAESQAASALIGSVFEAWDYPDGQLEPTLDLRAQVIHEIRTFKPDLVLTHRPYDYHPDHRAVAQLVQDASYMVTVPPIVPDTPILPRDPVVAYMPICSPGRTRCVQMSLSTSRRRWIKSYSCLPVIRRKCSSGCRSTRAFSIRYPQIKPLG